MQVTIGVGWFPVDGVVEGAVWAPGDEYVQKGYLSGLLLFHGELDAWVLLVEVLQKFEERVWTMGPHDKGVIYVAEPQTGSEVSGEE